MNFHQKDTIPAWRKLYNTFHERNYGERITYKEMKAVLKGYTSWRGPIYKCNKEMELNDNKTMKVEKNNGYIIVNPNEHITLSHKRVIRGRRQLVKGKRTAEATNVSMLTSQERQDLLTTHSKIARILQAVNKRTATTVKEAEKKAVVEMNLSDIEGRLKRIEQAMKKKKKKATG